LQIDYFRYIIISNSTKTLERSLIQLNNSDLEIKRKNKKLIDTENNKKKQKGKQKIKCSYQWFRTLVNRHIGEDRKQHPCTDQGKSVRGDHEGFRFNSATEKEELV